MELTWGWIHWKQRGEQHPWEWAVFVLVVLNHWMFDIFSKFHSMQWEMRIEEISLSLCLPPFPMCGYELIIFHFLFSDFHFHQLNLLLSCRDFPLTRKRKMSSNRKNAMMNTNFFSSFARKWSWFTIFNHSKMFFQSFFLKPQSSKESIHLSDLHSYVHIDVSAVPMR